MVKCLGCKTELTQPFEWDLEMYVCPNCHERCCDECGSSNLEGYDDGEGYPPDIVCRNCGNWM